jgi:hypothetical protein
MSEPYCRLYIDTDDDRQSVQDAVDAVLREAFGELRVDAPVRKNTGFVSAARSRYPYDPIACSPLTSEVASIDERPEDVPHFQTGTVQLVRRLRACGYVVTASCDFEDRVARETGWNWSTQATEPPGR